MDENTELRTIRKSLKHVVSFDVLPMDVSIVKLMGVHYAHLKTSDGGDLYVTKYGLSFLEHLKPENWYEREWFRKHRERLNGTSTVYKVPTKPIHNRSIDLVVKWSRVGQDVPLETKVIDDILNAEFNSPFEEFALVEEMRIGNYGPPELRIYSQRPMAIYVPPERLQLWQTGRSKYKINMKVKRHPGVELDILRQYILMYEWIKGVDAAEAFHQLRIPQEKLHALTHKVQEDLRTKGFWVADFKPAHIIIRKRNDGSFVHRHDEILYGVVDFELLSRTPEHEAEIKKAKRAEYLIRQRDRFTPPSIRKFPPYLKQVNLMGVEYIYGHVESTGGELWVVGKDPDLFDYFQPERWRKTPQLKLSDNHQVYYTQTKDNIHLVWKTSRVGEVPEIDSADEAGRRMIDYGYNSPFEEFSYALALNARGIPTTYPRAIYMTGPQSEAPYIKDRRRYESHARMITPDGKPILRPDHDYIKIWGFWNGPDELLAEENSSFHRGVSALQALREGLLPEILLAELIQRMRERLATAGFESLNLTSHHLLLTRDPAGNLVRDAEGFPETRLCNFEMMRPLGKRY
jgi:hypothetical protein